MIESSAQKSLAFALELCLIDFVLAGRADMYFLNLR
jgi:hypothetical protein